MAVILRVFNGRLSGTRFNFNQASILVGRGEENDLPLEYEGVSREHFRIEVDDRGPHLRDLGSRNGTLVNGERSSGDVLLEPGDRIAFGSCLLVLCDDRLRGQVRLQALSGEAVGREFTISRVPFTIGRGNQADLTLPDKLASREHTMIDRDGERYTVADNGSRNGTLLNGSRLDAVRPLRSGARIGIGDTVLDFVDGRVEDLAGTVLGDHSLLNRFGSGGGVVYEAKSISSGAKVAVKVFEPAIADDPREKARIENAIRNQSRVSHTNCNQVFDLDHQDGLTFLASAWCENGSVADLVPPDASDADDLPPPLVVAALLLDAARGLAAAARERIFHQGLRPGDVLIGGDGVGCVADFGTCRPATGGQGLPSPFAAPEELDGQASDALSNQYSLGGIGYFALVGATPHPDEDGGIPPLVGMDPPLPAKLAATVDRMMATRREERFPDWNETIAELEKAIAAGDGRADEPRPLTDESSRPTAARRRGAARYDTRAAERARRHEKQQITTLSVVAAVLLVIAIVLPSILERVLGG